MSDKDVEVLKRMNEKILGLLNSDPDTKRMGLVEKVDTLSEKLDFFLVKYNEAEAVKKAKIAVWATLGGMIALFFKSIASFILDHFKL